MSDYGRVAVGIAGQGFAGVLVPHPEGAWTTPGFYNFGEISIGPQAGADAWEIAMILLTDKALQAFDSECEFALSDTAGVTILNYSDQAIGSAGGGDVMLWSATKGAFVGLNIGVSSIRFDAKESAALYGRTVRPQEIVAGRNGGDGRKVAGLLQALPN